MTAALASGRETGPRQRLAAWIEGARVQRAIVALIALNAVTLGLETFPAVMTGYGDALHVVDRVLLAVFTAELALKLAAHGWRFFRNPWNVFDFAVIGVALLPATGPLSVLRALRVLRVLRLVSAVPRMRFVVESLVRSLPGIGSIALLLVLFFYVFAVMATKLFGEGFPHWFGSLCGSMFSLFQIMTLEGWADIAREVMAEHPAAWIYFLAFILLGTFTVLNLFIAVIVNATQEPAAADAPAVATSADIESLRAEIAALREALRRQGPG